MKRKLTALLLALLLCLGGLAVSYCGAPMQESGDYDIKYAAACQMSRCMAQIRAYKAELSLPISDGDVHGTGMIGDYVTDITTTLGALDAKRSTANPDMAALVVSLLREAGVRSGDTVGAGFSGSFPALDLAVLCACEAMGVQCVYIASVGASTYGANQPELTLPDMLCRLVQDGYLSTLPAAITPGGADDIGRDMEQSALDGVLARLEGYEVPIVRLSSFSENIAWRMALYQKNGPISCFIGVGGNVTTLGQDGTALRQGVVRPDRTGAVSARSGLLERYSAAGLPVIQLLNIKKLLTDYGMPFDPAVPVETGTSAVYYEKKPRLLPAAISLAAALAVFVFTFRAGSDRTPRQEKRPAGRDADTC